MAGMMQEFSEVYLVCACVCVCMCLCVCVCVCVCVLKVALGKTVWKQSQNGAAAENDIQSLTDYKFVLFVGDSHT